MNSFFLYYVSYRVKIIMYYLKNVLKYSLGSFDSVAGHLVTS